MLLIKKWGWIFFTICFCQTSAYANAAATTLSQLLSNVQTMRADFTQTLTDKNARGIQQSTGTVALQRPGKFRWEVRKPVAQIVVTNGARLWIYDPDLEQVTIRFLSKEIGESPAMLLSHPQSALEKEFDVQVAADSSITRWFLLKPKNPNSMFSLIKLGFMNDVMHNMILQDHLGHTTSIEFYHIKINPILSASFFSFKIPPKVDVIDETQR